MKIGNLIEVKKGLYKTVNGKLTIELTVKKGHMHVKVKGMYKRSQLTSVRPLNKLECAVLATYVYMQLHSHSIAAFGDLDLLNSAELFGSCFTFGAI